MTQIKFIAFGEPKPAGSKTAFAFKRKNGTLGAAVVDACKGGKAWAHVVASAAREVYQGELIRGAVSFSASFYFPRPKGHYNSKGGLKPSAPAFHTKRPDALKLARNAEDSLTGIVLADDSQIVQEFLFKGYGEPARCEIEIKTLC